MNRAFRTTVMIAMGICVTVPFILLVMRSMTDAWVYPDLIPDMSFDGFRRYIDSGRITEPLKDSIILSSMVTFMSMLIGFHPARIFATRQFRGKIALYIALLLPAVTPGICIIFGMIGVLIELGIYRTYISLVLCQTAFTAPYFIFTMIPVFKRFDTALEEQSAVLGVGRSSTLFNVTMPAMKSGLATSCMLTFVISWSMYLVTSICAPRGFSTMATTLLPLLGTGYATDSFVAITAMVFLIPALLSLTLSTLVMGSDRNNSGKM